MNIYYKYSEKIPPKYTLSCNISNKITYCVRYLVVNNCKMYDKYTMNYSFHMINMGLHELDILRPVLEALNLIHI